MTALSGPRVRPGGMRDVGPAAYAFAWIAGRMAGTKPPHIFLTLGRHRRLFWAWLHFAGRLMPGGLLPRRDSELVILRVAHLANSDYETAHHRRLGRRAGLTAAEIDRVADGAAAPGWTSRDQTLLSAVDSLHRHGDLDDDTWSTLRSHLDEREAIELCQLVGHYEMLATTVRVLRIAPDAPR